MRSKRIMQVLGYAGGLILLGCSPSLRTPALRLNCAKSTANAELAAECANLPFAVPSPTNPNLTAAPTLPASIYLVQPLTSPGNVRSPQVRIAGALPGQTLSLFSAADCSLPSILASGVAVGADLDLLTTPLADGLYHFYVDATNSAGFVSACSEAMVEYRVDTAPPQLSAVAVQAPGIVRVTFNEALNAGALVVANYTLSGAGQGTLAAHPDSVAYVSGQTYSLTWNAGNMLNGGDVTIAVAGSTDLAGNPAAGTRTQVGGALGQVPAVTGLSNDGAVAPAKTWNWGCSEPGCVYRFIIDQSSATSPAGAFGATSSATQGSSSGTYYVHVQAKDPAGNLSPVVHASALLLNQAATIFVRQHQGATAQPNSDNQERIRNDGPTPATVASIKIKFADTAASAKVQLWQGASQVGGDSDTQALAGGGWRTFTFSTPIALTGNYAFKLVTVSGTPTFYVSDQYAGRYVGSDGIVGQDGYHFVFELNTVQPVYDGLLVKEDFDTGAQLADWTFSDYYGYLFWNFTSAPAPLQGAYSLAVTGTGRFVMREFAPQDEIWASWRHATSDIDYESSLRLIDADNNLLVNYGIVPSGGVTGTGMSSAPAGTIAAGVPAYWWLHYIKGTGANAILETYISPTATRPALPTMSGYAGTQTAQAAGILLFNDNYNASILDNVRVSTSPLGGAVSPYAATSLGWSSGATAYVTALTASWTKSASTNIASQSIQFYTGAACDTPNGAAVPAAATAQTQSFTGISNASYTYKVTSTDASGNATVSPCSAAVSVQVPTWTKSGTVYTTDGTQSCVNSALGDASPGDTVNLPAGTYAWGAGNNATVINKAVTLAGAGQGATIINQAADSTLLFVIQGPAVVKSFTVNQQNGKRLFYFGGGDGWRLTDLAINGAGSGRIFDIEGSYGVVDHSNISIFTEQIFMYGKTDAWTTASTAGTDQAVFIEDCVFNGSGDAYTDGNANAKFVYRFNTVNIMMKFDAHGVWSDTPNHSSRNLESYFNTWTPIGDGSWMPTHEIRGGTGYVFFNSALDNTYEGRGVLKLREYGATALGGYFPRYQGPDDYPIFEQVGVGQGLAAEPLYLWGNRKAGSYPSGGAMEIITDWSTIPAQAIDEYRTRIGNPTATYTMDDIIVRDRDYFIDPYTGGGAGGGTLGTFNGSSGVGIGTYAQMSAITPSKLGVGFWVTDRGSWNTTLPANTSGQLYAWNGTSWQLRYVPYTYPHP